jgi:two-component system response regulator FixJ
MSESFNPANGEICVVDDDPPLLDSIQKLLESVGLPVRVFDRPEDFLNFAATNRVSLVVLDIWMEKVTGLEVLARLCALSPQTRVIVITARDDLAARATAMQIGPVAFFIKPFNDEKFLAAVRDALAQAQKLGSGSV